MKIKDKTFVVSGGGDGLGRELTLNLMGKGARVAALDISEAALRETESLAGQNKPNLSTHVLNVTDRAFLKSFPQLVIDAHGSVDGLINNAGIIHAFKKFNDLEYEAIERVINVNLYGVINLTKTFLPHFLTRPEAHIVNVSSMGGFSPVPGQTLYGASKAGVKILTEGLYAELLETNVHVSVVIPGAIDTNVMENSGVKNTALDTPSAKLPPITKPDVAAETITRSIEKNKFKILVGKDARMMDILYRLHPEWATKLMYNQMKFLISNDSLKPVDAHGA